MFRNPIQKPPRWWSPKISPFWIRFWRPFRLRRQRRLLGLEKIEVRGLEHLRRAIDDGHAVMVTPNHPAPPDPYVMLHVADELGEPFYFMAAWQTFGRAKWVVQQMFRHHGVFSVDREGTDLRAFKHAVQILQTGDHPLVIFPEGEVYHINDRLTPFREGPAAIALSAIKKAEHPVSVIPAAIKYHYLEDPTPELAKTMDRLEQEIFWRPRREMPLRQRIYQFAEAALAIKELEYAGQTSAGPLPPRIAALSDHILGRLENDYGIDAKDMSIPERIKTVRHRAVKQLEDLSQDSPQCGRHERALDDAFLVVQLFSYPGDYVAEQPASVERIAETIDKFEEDVLGERNVASRGRRQATVSLGEAVNVKQFAADKSRREAIPALIDLLEERVQQLLDEIDPPPRDFGAMNSDTPDAA